MKHKRKKIDCLAEYTLRKIPNLHQISWCENFVEMYSFLRVSGESSKTQWKLFIFTKFPHQEIRSNFDILCSGNNNM